MGGHDMHKKLFIPGPVDVREDVLQKMAMPQISHRGKEATELQERISKRMQKLMFTENDIILSTTSGSGLMEMAVKSLTKKRAAVFSVGAFGDRWFKMCTANGIPADKFKSETAEPTTPEMVEEALATGKYDVVTVTHNETSTGIMNPVGEIAKVVAKYPDVMFCVDTVSSLGGAKVPVDEWGIDMCITSTQKCLGLPAGLAIASVSNRAYDRAKTVENRGLYLDLVEVVDKVRSAYQYPSTPSLAHMFALDYQLEQIVEVEGIENRFNRHFEMAEVVRAWADKHFKILPDRKYASNTLTTMWNTKEINVGDLNKELAKRGWMISNGYGDLKEKTFRIAHMADTQMETLQELLREIEDILGLK
jgi:aspartate aminotransferase-like enzyme